MRQVARNSVQSQGASHSRRLPPCAWAGARRGEAVAIRALLIASRRTLPSSSPSTVPQGTMALSMIWKRGNSFAVPEDPGETVCR